MAKRLMIQLVCPDRVGLVADICSRIADLNGDLGDVTFGDMAPMAKFSAVCDFPDDIDKDRVEQTLKQVEGVSDGSVSVGLFTMSTTHDPRSEITHRVDLAGFDHPGIVSGVAPVIAGHDAQIVRMSGYRLTTPGEYVLRLALNVPADQTESCLADLNARANELDLRCEIGAA